MSDRMICNRLVEGISQGKTDEGSYHRWSLGLSVEDCGTYKEIYKRELQFENKCYMKYKKLVTTL